MTSLLSPMNLLSEMSPRCSPLCLGPLTFHRQAVGDKVRLSKGGRRAEKTETTFKNGLVFSSRPVKVQERIRLRVEKNSFIWEGTLCVGFTNVPPSARSLPLPCKAIPNLTARPGHWAVPVHKSYCQAGSELEFWFSSGGSIYAEINNRQYKLLAGLDLSQPLWAMVDIHGQTSSILLLGKFTRATCLSYNLSLLITDKRCVVCMVHKTQLILHGGRWHFCKYCYCSLSAIWFVSTKDQRSKGLFQVSSEHRDTSWESPNKLLCVKLLTQ
uniref:NHR domain-containing protein n=1 Tax=Amphilophus citrinellus TaxID=61819 RepID=A0A3Q0SDV0_AMPCI